MHSKLWKIKSYEIFIAIVAKFHMNFFATLESILQAPSSSEKIEAFNAFYETYKNGGCSFEEGYEPVVFETPAYAPFTNVVEPKDVPKRKNLTDDEGQLLLLHAIAHIEYSAIDLALDAVYRFAGLPKAYYDDWLEVADDEVRHFQMIDELMKEVGGKYGDVPVHNMLFEASMRTLDFLDRMAVVPRFLEANGLDATPEIVEKLNKLPKGQKHQPMIEKIIAALGVIVEEEVDHVLKGDRWFEYACENEGVDKSVYFEIVDKYYPNSFPRKKYLNIEARKEAGFSCSELNTIASERIC
jgi:uncharacterized ferritin-like protein (DUF455 family)